MKEIFTISNQTFEMKVLKSSIMVDKVEEIQREFSGVDISVYSSRLAEKMIGELMNSGLIEIRRVSSVSGARSIEIVGYLKVLRKLIDPYSGPNIKPGTKYSY